MIQLLDQTYSALVISFLIKDMTDYQTNKTLPIPLYLFYLGFARNSFLLRNEIVQINDDLMAYVDGRKILIF